MRKEHLLTHLIREERKKNGEEKREERVNLGAYEDGFGLCCQSYRRHWGGRVSHSLVEGGPGGGKEGHRPRAKLRDQSIILKRGDSFFYRGGNQDRKGGRKRSTVFGTTIHREGIYFLGGEVNRRTTKKRGGICLPDNLPGSTQPHQPGEGETLLFGKKGKKRSSAKEKKIPQPGLGSQLHGTQSPRLA